MWMGVILANRISLAMIRFIAQYLIHSIIVFFAFIIFRYNVTSLEGIDHEDISLSLNHVPNI